MPEFGKRRESGKSKAYEPNQSLKEIYNEASRPRPSSGYRFDDQIDISATVNVPGFETRRPEGSFEAGKNYSRDTDAIVEVPGFETRRESGKSKAYEPNQSLKEIHREASRPRERATSASFGIDASVKYEINREPGHSLSDFPAGISLSENDKSRAYSGEHKLTLPRHDSTAGESSRFSFNYEIPDAKFLIDSKQDRQDSTKKSDPLSNYTIKNDPRTGSVHAIPVNTRQDNSYPHISGSIKAPAIPPKSNKQVPQPTEKNYHLRTILYEANYQPDIFPSQTTQSSGQFVIRETIRPSKDYESVSGASSRPVSSRPSIDERFIIRKPSTDFDSSSTYSPSSFKYDDSTSDAYVVGSIDAPYIKINPSPQNQNTTTLTPKISLTGPNAELKRIILEATRNNPSQLISPQKTATTITSSSIVRRQSGTIVDQRRFEAAAGEKRTMPDSALLSSLAALTQITALGADESASEEKATMPDSSLFSALAALTQITALGADEKSEDPVDLKAQGTCFDCNNYHTHTFTSIRVS